MISKAACAVLTASFVCASAVAADRTHLVRPIDWTKYTEIRGVKDGDAFGKKISESLQRESSYLNSWIATEYPLHTNAVGLKYYDPPTAKMGYEGAVRPLAQFAWSKAVMIQTGIYPAKGKALQDAIADTELAIRGVAFSHVSQVPGDKSWGAVEETSSHDWQSAYWASTCAAAAWMLWEHLHPTTKATVVQMLEYEANRFASPTTNLPADYWKDKNGKVAHESTAFLDGHIGGGGDSKAESDGWIARAFVVAQAMMPEHPNAALWRKKASEFMIASYSRESDLKNTTKIDGKPVKDWLNGFNTFDEGVLLNHDMVHPGYMTAHAFTYSTLVDASLAGQYIPESSFFNEQITWDALTKLNFPAGEDRYGTGKNRPPGGTAYQKKADGTLNPTPYFPSGDSWSDKPEADVDYVLFNVYAAVRGLDAGQDVRAIDWATAQVDALRGLQARPGHRGNFYEAGDFTAAQDVIEVVTFQDLTEAWMVWWLHQHNMISPVSDHWGSIRAGK
jgi:hypothetical protein